MWKSKILAAVTVLGLVAMSTSVQAGGWFVSGYRYHSGPHASFYRARTVVNPPGPAFYSSRTVSVGYAPRYVSPGFVTGPVYPASAGYQFTPYYYPVAPVYAAPVYVTPMPMYYGW